MIRGIYTGASSMVAKQVEMDVIANNLANVNTTGFKKDEVSYKAFPEMLLRRFNDDGVHSFPLGSYDTRPVIWKLGTGVEVNEVYNQKEQAGFKKTSNPLDFALKDKGYFSVQTPGGERYTRNGSFIINNGNILTTKEGYPVLGLNGPIQIKNNNFSVNKRGEIYANQDLNSPLARPVQIAENGFENAVLVDQLKLVDFEFDRYLDKEANSFFSATEESGKAFLKNNSEVEQGFFGII